MHVEEQRAEIAQCQTGHGKTPLKVILDQSGDVGDLSFMTLVHCTHSTYQDMAEYARRGGNVCVCPLTEGSLADGLPGHLLNRSPNSQLVVGTDSNLRIDFLEELRCAPLLLRCPLRTTPCSSSLSPALETNLITFCSSLTAPAPLYSPLLLAIPNFSLIASPPFRLVCFVGTHSRPLRRWLEYGQRLRSGERGHFSVRDLLDVATVNGARSLQLPVGRLAPGCLADFVLLNTEAAVLQNEVRNSFELFALHGCA
jgi:cytosine/adenosine deaminase-related metal-dependent hydrolase